MKPISFHFFDKWLRKLAARLCVAALHDQRWAHASARTGRRTVHGHINHTHTQTTTTTTPTAYLKCPIFKQTFILPWLKEFLYVRGRSVRACVIVPGLWGADLPDNGHRKVEVGRWEWRNLKCWSD
jgi:hypothetical protein